MVLGGRVTCAPAIRGPMGRAQTPRQRTNMQFDEYDNKHMSQPNSATTNQFRSGLFSKIIENTAWLLGANVLGGILSVVYLGIATRALGPANFGQFVLIVGIAQSVAMIVNFQTWQILVRYGAGHLHEEQYGRLGRLIVYCLAVDVGAAIVGAALVTGAVFLLGPPLGWDESTQNQALLFAVIMLISIRSTPTGILRLHDRFGLAAVADAVTPLARMIGAIIVILNGASIVGFLAAWAVAEAATALVYWAFAIYALGPEYKAVLRMRLDNVRRENPRILRFTTLTNAGSILNAASNQSLVIIVGLFVGTAAAGGFRLARQIGLALAKFTRTLGRAAFPELVRANSAASEKDFWRLFKMTTALAAAGALIIFGLLFLFGHQAIILIAGSEFAFATPLLLLLGSAAAIDLVGVGFDPALIATGRAGRVAVLRLISTVVLLSLMFTLLPIFGAIGGAAAVLIATIFNLFLFTISTWRLMGKPDGRRCATLGRSLVRPTK